MMTSANHRTESSYGVFNPHAAKPGFAPTPHKNPETLALPPEVAVVHRRERGPRLEFMCEFSDNFPHFLFGPEVVRTSKCKGEDHIVPIDQLCTLVHSACSVCTKCVLGASHLQVPMCPGCLRLYSPGELQLVRSSIH